MLQTYDETDILYEDTNDFDVIKEINIMFNVNNSSKFERENQENFEKLLNSMTTNQIELKINNAHKIAKYYEMAFNMHIVL